MLNQAAFAVAAFRRGFGRIDPEELRYGAEISIWVRWFGVVVCLVIVTYQGDHSEFSYLLDILYHLVPVAVNGYVHYRIRTNRAVTWYWLLALSVMDLAQASIGTAITGGFVSPFFVFCFPAVSVFASVFTSPRIIFSWTTLVAAIYTGLCLVVGPGLEFDGRNEVVLFARLAALYSVSVTVNLITRSERLRRRAAVERERELQRERIELSKSIHDTVAQSAYLIGLGIETAIELTDRSNRELVEKLEATHDLSKSAVWELRHPIDGGLIFEGRGLAGALRSHAATFTAITSIPAELVQLGSEPPLSRVNRGLVFSIAHNAMTNAFRHSRANRVTITLDCQPDRLRMSVADDGVGLPDDYAERGHGFRNMRENAQRIGGELEVATGGSGPGTTVTCVIHHEPPNDPPEGGR